MQQDDYEKLLQKYKQKIKEEFGEQASKPSRVSSQEYTEFKRELYPASYTFFEKSCNFSQTILKLKTDPVKAERVQKNLDLCHLNTTPSAVTSFAITGSV